MLDGSD